MDPATATSQLCYWRTWRLRCLPFWKVEFTLLFYLFIYYILLLLPWVVCYLVFCVLFCSRFVPRSFPCENLLGRLGVKSQLVNYPLRRVSCKQIALCRHLILFNKQEELTAIYGQRADNRPDQPTVTQPGMRVTTRYINSTKCTSSKQDAPHWHNYYILQFRHTRRYRYVQTYGETIILLFIVGRPSCIRVLEQRFFIAVRSQVCTGIRKNSLILMFIPGGPICVRLPEQRFFIVVRSQMCTGIQKNSLILMFIPVDLSA